MTLALLAVLAAVLFGLAFGGRPSTLIRPPLNRAGLLGIVIIAIFTSGWAKSVGVYAGWLVTGALALAWFIARNRGRPGTVMIAAGLVSNVVVISLNAGMPVALEALERAGVPFHRTPLDVLVPVDVDPLREQLTTATVLPWLGEAIPLALPLRPAVASVGDVLIAAGAALFLFSGLTGMGREVPKRLETPKEKRERRQRERNAKRADAAAAEAGSAGLPVGALSGSSRRLGGLGDPDPTSEDGLAAAPAGGGSVASAQSSDQTSTTPPPDPVLDDAPGELDAADVLAAERAAAEAEEERKKVNRQVKKLKKQRKQLKRTAAAAAAAAAATPESGADGTDQLADDDDHQDHEDHDRRDGHEANGDRAAHEARADHDAAGPERRPAVIWSGSAPDDTASSP